MANKRRPALFYSEVIEELLRTNILSKDSKILVVCGGTTDKDTLSTCGLENVVVSNLDVRMQGDEFAPYEWSFQDAENLTFPDDSFDFCIVHKGLHHCHSPHRALLEMYRVSGKGLLLIEPHDGFLTRLGVRWNIGQEYEHAAVYYNDCSYGGVACSPIPNFVYRFTEQEIVKTINSYAPYGKHRIRFIHKISLPWGQLTGRKNKGYYYAALLLTPLLQVLRLVFSKAGNNFAAVVLKPEFPHELHPWLTLGHRDEIELNMAWLEERYSRSASFETPAPRADAPVEVAR